MANPNPYVALTASVSIAAKSVVDTIKKEGIEFYDQNAVKEFRFHLFYELCVKEGLFVVDGKELTLSNDKLKKPFVLNFPK